MLSLLSRYGQLANHVPISGCYLANIKCHCKKYPRDGNYNLQGGIKPLYSKVFKVIGGIASCIGG